MHSQKEFKPIYGSFSGREAIEIVTKNLQKNMALKVPFNIGFPSIRRGGTKIKVTSSKPKDYGKEPNVSYSQAVMKAKQMTRSVSIANRQMTQANKIITTQASSTVITNGNGSSTLVKPSITTQVSLGNQSSVNQPSSQIVSSISNKSTSTNIQNYPSSPDKSLTTTSPDSHISNANNPLYNAMDCSSSTSVNSVANFSRSIPNCSSSKAPMNILNSSNMNNFQQNNVINSIRDTKPSSSTVQPQQENGYVNSSATMRKTSVWNGINSKVVNPTGVKEGSMPVRSQNTNQHQPVRNSYGPNTNVGSGKESSFGSVAIKPQQNHGVIGNTPSVGTAGKTSNVWNGINGSLKEQSILANDIAEQSSSRRSYTSNGSNNKDPIPSSVKYVEQQESDNKNNALSVTSTPSSSRRSSESNGTNSKELTSSSVKNNAKKKKGDNDSRISSGLNTPSQSNTPGGSRRSSTSNCSNTIFASKESIKNVSRQVESDSRSNMSSVSTNTQSISRRPSESNGSKTTSNLLSSEKYKNNGLSNGTHINSSVNLSSHKQPSNERPVTENANMSYLNSNGAVPSNKSSTNWAAHLFSKDENQKATNENSKLNVTKPPPSPPVRSQKSQKAVSSTNGEPKVGGLTGLLKDFDPSFRNITMNPRGLINNGNMCFMNAILQTLSHCPPFCNLLTRIYKEVVHDFSNKTPLVDSLVRFIEEYKQMKRFEGSEEFGEAFSPEYVYDALRGLKRFDSMKGRQEDAEEFLGFLLGGLHEEFLSVLKKDEPKSQQSDQAGIKGHQKDDDWMEVGRKNRTSYTRTTNVEETPISRIFCGQFRSVLTCSGSSSITLQPYQSLQLDIQPDDVKTIGDALKNLTVTEYVDDFYSPKNGLVRATKRLCIETLPPILTLHLKRFIYDNVGGTQKLSKHIGYSTTLSIQPDIMARPSKAVEYQLFGVVYHHGKSATGGHYTADILCQNDWLHIDDTAISSISSSEVASVENPTQPTDRSAYILFYMRN